MTKKEYIEDQISQCEKRKNNFTKRDIENFEFLSTVNDDAENRNIEMWKNLSDKEYEEIVSHNESERKIFDEENNFYENKAKKLGLTLDEFDNMSSIEIKKLSRVRKLEKIKKAD